MLTLLSLAACPRTIPSHLIAPPPEAPMEDYSSPVAAMRSVLGGDPLARRPRWPADPALLDAAGLPELAALQAQLAEAHDAAALRAVEEEASLRPIVRGARLARAQSLLASGSGALGWSLEIAALISPLGPSSPLAPPSPRALPWLPANAAPDAPFQVAERWALSAWLSHRGPGLPDAAAALEAPTHDALRSTPHAALLLARVRGGTADPAPGLATLTRATALALEEASADRDAEQTAWRARRSSILTELGRSADSLEDPVTLLLQRAVDQLDDAASDDAAFGGAWLSLEALRWRGACADPPCGGVDRLGALQEAAAWSPRLAPLASTWTVVAWKEAIDGVEVAHGTVRFPYALVDLIDVLSTVARPALPADLLLRPEEDPTLWQTLAVALGVRMAPGWEEARAPLRARLATIAKESRSTVPSELHPLLDRVERRAQP
jgi:hypothetical protein